MIYRYSLTLLGLALMAIGLTEGRWFLLVIWLGGTFVALGTAHFLGLHGVFGKRPDGSLPVWSWVVFLPMHLCTSGLWHVTRLMSREPAYHIISDHLVVGRRLLPNEIAGGFANYVDLTSEFSKPSAIRCSQSYICFPILDGSAPDPDKLREVVNHLRPGKTFIHCAQGHGRTGLFATAVMLKSGSVRTASEGLLKLRTIRPGISLSEIQRRCLDEFVK